MTNKEEILQYCRDCINDVIPSGQKHKWACQRYINDLERIGTTDFPYIWDEQRADRIVKWFAMLKHSKGTLAGTPIELTAWQKFRECQIYGWIHRETGLRRFRKAFTECGRKNSKSQLESGEALYELSVTAVKTAR